MRYKHVLSFFLFSSPWKEEEKGEPFPPGSGEFKSATDAFVLVDRPFPESHARHGNVKDEKNERETRRENFSDH